MNDELLSNPPTTSMTPSEADPLYRRILDFSFDGPDPVAQTFADRLAHENNWSKHFTKRAIQEYRRFAYLAVIAGPVCPSEQVDQVWHLHLTYTRSYWDRFCKEILGKPLHHDPTSGGSQEDAKHRKLYADTLDAYRRIFGDEPPADIWPSADVRFGDDLHAVRVNARQHWIIRKTSVRSFAALAALFIVSVVLLTGCVGPILGAEWNPLALKNAEFLTFYPITYFIFMIVAIFVRQSYRKPDFDEQQQIPELDLYEKAYLAGGKSRVTHVALIQLVQQGNLKVDESGKFVGFGPEPENSFEQAIYYRLKTESPDQLTPKQIYRAISSAQVDEFDRLRNLELVCPAEQLSRAARNSFLISLIPLVIGVIRLINGLEGGHPVGYLIAMLIVTFFISLVGFARQPNWRTRRGDVVLARLLDQQRQLEQADVNYRPRQIGVALALFGSVVLVGTQYAFLKPVIQPPPGSNSGCGTGTGCSGGDGGGGGGGCGGGCGGGGD
jgi:uncharacterized protein (TIGR04222 family)